MLSSSLARRWLQQRELMQTEEFPDAVPASTGMTGEKRNCQAPPLGARASRPLFLGGRVETLIGPPDPPSRLTHHVPGATA